MLAIILYFIILTFKSLIHGGGWCLHQQLDFGNRLYELGEAFYASPSQNVFVPSSPYWPGVGLVAYFTRLIGVEDIIIQNEILVVIANVLSFFFLFCIAWFVKKHDKNFNYLTILAILFYYLLSFNHYKAYAGMFKPDTIILTVSFIALIILPLERTISSRAFILVLLLVFISTFFKQTSVINYLLVGGLVLFNKRIEILPKLLMLSMLIIAGSSVLIIFNMIENLFEWTVHILKGHPYFSSEIIFNIILTTVKQNLVFCVLLIFSVVYILLTKIELKYFHMTIGFYFLFSVFWLTFNSLAGFKVGGNSGNLEVGLIVFFPFVVFVANRWVVKLKSNYYVYSMSIAFLIILNSILLLRLVGVSEMYSATRASMQEMTNYLSKNYNGHTSFISGNNNEYIVAKNAGINIVADQGTVLHVKFSVSDYFKEMIKKQKFDVILHTDTTQFNNYTGGDEIKNLFSNNYVENNSKTVPLILTGKIFLKRNKNIKK